MFSIVGLLLILLASHPSEVAANSFHSDNCDRAGDDFCVGSARRADDTPLGLSLLQRAAHIVVSAHSGPSLEEPTLIEPPFPVVQDTETDEEEKGLADESSFGWPQQQASEMAMAPSSLTFGIDQGWAARAEVTTTTTKKKESAAAETGVSQNAVGDGTSFLMGLGTFAGMSTACSLIFSIARRNLVKLYTNNAPNRPPVSESFCGWVGDSLKLTRAEIQEVAGIDHAYLWDYTILCKRILVCIGIPLILIEVPLNIWQGGNAAGQDHLSWQGMANVKDGGPLYWFYAFLVWYVVIVTQIFIFRAMQQFTVQRFEWTIAMPSPQDRSILVEGIPTYVPDLDMEITTDEDLKNYFNKVFGRSVVQDAIFIKDTREFLNPAWVKRNQDRVSLQLAEAQLKQTGQRPMMRQGGICCGMCCCGGPRCRGKNIDKITFYTQEIAQGDTLIAAEQERIKAEAVVQGNTVVSASAFVTFKAIKDAAAATSINYSEDADEFIVERAPEPEDVIWSDLLNEPVKNRFRELIGFGILVLYFFGFLPVILAISTMTEIGTIEKHIPAVRHLIDDCPALGLLYNAVFGSIAITLVMSFLPSLIILVFDQFYVLKSTVASQYKLQQTYFFFLVMFVLLVTAIGTSLVNTISEVVKSPLKIFSLLATSLPESSHYYLNYVVTQWGTYFLGLTRYMQMIKFIIFKRSMGEDGAKLACEPEDQDYYGMGSRSARFAAIMVIVLVFCTLSPLIVILGYVNFSLCQLIFGYLFVYAENIKPDLGGAFYVRQLDHTQIGLFIYVAVMTGVLYQRASNQYPGLVAGFSFVPLIWSYLRFQRRFKWDCIPNDYLQFSKGKEVKKRKCDKMSYVQPDLCSGDDLNEEGDGDGGSSRFGGGFNAFRCCSRPGASEDPHASAQALTENMDTTADPFLSGNDPNLDSRKGTT